MCIFIFCEGIETTSSAAGLPGEIDEPRYKTENENIKKDAKVSATFLLGSETGCLYTFNLELTQFAGENPVMIKFP